MPASSTIAAVLIALAVAALVRPPRAVSAGRPRRDADRSHRLAVVLIGALCAVLIGAGAGIAWTSQQHWLARQHYTVLYAAATAGGEQVTVHNHEGQRVTYLARIDAAGDQVAIVRFTLGVDGTWQRTFAVNPDQATAGAPLLYVELGRVGVPGVYRWIRLLRPQPSASPSG